jgi:hypothetical protein
MSKLSKQRFSLLKPWYPELTSAGNWVHQSCLAQLGLHPFPKECLPLEEIIGSKLAARIGEIVSKHPTVRGPRMLIDIVYGQMCKELRVPTPEGNRQLRYMVAHWVTTRLAGSGGRGGVTFAEDVPGCSLTEADVVATVDSRCRLSEWMSQPDAVSEATAVTPVPDVTALIAEAFRIPEDKMATVNELINNMNRSFELQKDAHLLAIERAKVESETAIARSREESRDTISIINARRVEMVDAAKARQSETQAATARSQAETETVNARCREVELQMKMMQMKRTSAPSDDPPPCKKARKVAPGPAADMPRNHGKRFSISHIVWADLAEEEEDQDVPDVETVFRAVRRWFKNREGAPYKCPLDTEVLRADNDVPVVYVLPAEFRRGFAERHRDDLVRHVRRTLMPAANAPPDNKGNCGEAARTMEPAPCFLQARVAPPPQELLPPSLAQQAQDLAHLARMTRGGFVHTRTPGGNGHPRGGLAGTALAGARGAPAHRGHGAGLPGTPQGQATASRRVRAASGVE